MQGQAAAVAQRARLAQVVERQRPAVPGVLQRQQPAAREVRVVGLDRRLDGGQRQGAVGGLRQRLRLDRAEHRGATALVAIGVGVHADDVFVAARAVAQQGDQVGLGAAGQEQARLETEVGGQAAFQGDDGGVLAVDVVADLGVGHGGPHGRGRAGDGVAAQVDQGHRRIRSGGRSPLSRIGAAAAARRRPAGGGARHPDAVPARPPPLHCRHEDRELERELAQGPAAAPGAMVRAGAAGSGRPAGDQAGRPGLPRRGDRRARLPGRLQRPAHLQRRRPAGACANRRCRRRRARPGRPAAPLPGRHRRWRARGEPLRGQRPGGRQREVRVQAALAGGGARGAGR